MADSDWVEETCPSCGNTIKVNTKTGSETGHAKDCAL